MRLRFTPSVTLAAALVAGGSLGLLVDHSVIDGHHTAVLVALILLSAFSAGWAILRWRHRAAQAISMRRAQSIARMGSLTYDFTTDRWSRAATLHDVLCLGPDAPTEGRGWAAFLDQLSASKAEFLSRVVSTPGDAGRREYMLDDIRGGGCVWVDVHTEISRNADGKALSIIAIIQDITKRKLDEREIIRLGSFDGLTGLSNRASALQHVADLAQACRDTGGSGAILFINLNGFKRINDARGHAHGDVVLKEAAKRLLACSRPADLVARLSADEFLLVLDHVAGTQLSVKKTIASTAQMVLHALARPYELDEQEYHSSACVGVRLFSSDATPPEVLVEQASMAMRKAKESDLPGVVFFDSSIQRQIQQKASMERDLRIALTREQLTLHYQPQVDAAGIPTGAEILLRWQHPAQGMVSPAIFIPVAEESRLIVDIGSYVLKSACAQLKRWSQIPGFEHLSLAVNVSPRQFAEDDFVAKISRLISVHGFAPHLLKLEITEGLMVKDVDAVIAKMLALKKLGVVLSMDDFGTGYSSLSSLKRLPVHQLKIDHSFVRDLCADGPDAMMVKTIINMAQNFGMQVIAEGVETESQLEFLQRNGCIAFQGYFFARPMPVSGFESYVDANRTH